MSGKGAPTCTSPSQSSLRQADPAPQCRGSVVVEPGEGTERQRSLGGCRLFCQGVGYNFTLKLFLLRQHAEALNSGRYGPTARPSAGIVTP